MARSRRNKRISKKIVETISNKVFIATVIASMIVILSCVCIIMIKQHNDKIRLAEERKKLEETILAIFEDTSDDEENDEEQVIGTGLKYDVVANIAVVGDILCDDQMIADAKSGDTYNFDPMFNNIKSIIEKADLAIGTMETNFTDNAYSDYIQCNSPKEFAQAVKNSGIDLVTMAQNHALDYGKDGLEVTNEYLENLEFEVVGVTIDEQPRYKIQEVKGIKIAFLAYTYGVNKQSQRTQEELSYVNLYEEEKVKQDIESAKLEADYIIAMMHWGDVNSSTTSNKQEEMAKFLVDNGVDAIVGAHPSVVQPMEVVQNTTGKNVFVAYSIGNYISNLGYQDSNSEIILNIQIRKDKDTQEVTLDKITYTPVYVLDNGNRAENRFELVDMQETAKSYAEGNKDKINDKTYKILLKALEKLEQVVRSKVN